MIDGLDVKIEDDVRRHLASWKRWQLGEGVAGVGSTLGYSDERMMTTDSNRNNDRPVVITHECERTNRAVLRMKAEDWRGWAALDCYHFRTEAKRACAKACRVHHREIEAILRRAHENLLHFRREDAYSRISINPAPVLA